MASLKAPNATRTDTADAADTDMSIPRGATEAGVAGAPGPSRGGWKRTARRAATVASVTAGVLLVVALALYLFGGMERPSSEVRAAYAQLVDGGSVVPVRGGFVIPIPGCRCHSTDPVSQVEHSTYRIRDCRGCH